MDKSISISSSMEDYLETILNLTKKTGSARVSEIAESLNIAASSVTEVMGKLSKMKLITQEKYGPVILTKKGRGYAERIAYRHQVIKDFLIDVLGVNAKIAEKDACLMEHVMSPVTMQHLVDYLADVNDDSRGGNNEISNFKVEHGGDDKMETSNINSLSELAVGEQGKVVRINAQGSLKRRFLDMGLVQGVQLKVKGKAPLGDPIKVDVKGYNLSLRKKEASEIYVEVE